jgi:ABC-2 type transport system ATP-binding protein
MIEVSDISKSYGRVEAVRGVSFTASPGEALGILGPNGAGKTTTIRMITGWLPPTSGRVTIDGQDSVDHSLEVRRKLGYLPETTPLYPEMRVAGYLDYRGRLFGMRRTQRRAAIDRRIDQCALGQVRTRRIGELSKGYRQRVGLASALLHDPPILILDEPTSGLDPSQIAESRNLIRELARTKTVLLSSHILPEVEKTCDRVLIIAQGRVRAQGRLDELASSRRHTLEALADGSRALAAVRALEGVESAEASGCGSGWVRLTVEATPSAGDLREALSASMRVNNWPVRELTIERTGLETLFASAVEGAQ